MPILILKLRGLLRLTSHLGWDFYSRTKFFLIVLLNYFVNIVLPLFLLCFIFIFVFGLYWKFINRKYILNFGLLKQFFIFFWPMRLIIKCRVFLRYHLKWIAFHTLNSKPHSINLAHPNRRRRLKIRNVLHLHWLVVYWLLHLHKTRVLFDRGIVFFCGKSEKPKYFRLKRSVGLFFLLGHSRLIKSIIYKLFLLFA